VAVILLLSTWTWNKQ